jgi:hypothetical protein
MFYYNNVEESNNNVEESKFYAGKNIKNAFQKGPLLGQV